jgi:hypothetical protein
MRKEYAAGVSIAKLAPITSTRARCGDVAPTFSGSSTANAQAMSARLTPKDRAAMKDYLRTMQDTVR